MNCNLAEGDGARRRVGSLPPSLDKVMEEQLQLNAALAAGVPCPPPQEIKAAAKYTTRQLNLTEFVIETTETPFVTLACL